MNTLLSIVIPIIIIVTLGYFFRRSGLVRPNWMNILNKFTYYVSLPALIIVSFSKIEWNANTAYFIFLHCGFIVVTTFLLYLFLKLFRLPKKTSLVIILTAIVGNTVYIGFPVLQALYKNSELSLGLSAATFQLVLGLIFGVILVEFSIGKKKLSNSFKELSKNPLLISLALGILVSIIFSGGLPQSLNSVFTMLGSTASPLALFTLGAFFYKELSLHYLKLSILASVVKLILLPFFALVLFKLSNTTSIQVDMSVLIAGMPTAVSTFVIAEKYDLNAELAGNIVLLSTVSSLLTLSFIILKTIY